MVKKIFVVFLLLFIQKLSFAQKDSNVILRAKELNKKFGFCDEGGNMIIPYIYDYASNFYEELAVVMLEKKVGLINKKNEIIVPLIYDDAGEPSEGLIAVNKGGKWGVINKSNKVIIPTIYDQLYLTYHGWIEARKDGLEGILNDQNKIIFPFKYNQISVDYDGTIYVQLYKNGGFINGCVSFQNKVIIPLIYDRPLNFQSDGLSEAQRGIYSYKINRQNKIVGNITAKYPNGDIYIGQIENNIKNGFGTIEFANGTKYVGNWANDRMNGEGTYYVSAKEKYKGHFREGMYDGYGTYYYDDGSTFSGQWEKNEKVIKDVYIAFKKTSEWEEINSSNGDGIFRRKCQFVIYVDGNIEKYVTFKTSLDGEWLSSFIDNNIISTRRETISSSEIKSDLQYFVKSFMKLNGKLIFE